jgi:hypothetical protein
MKAGYVRNLVRHPRVRLKVRDGLRARWHTGTAQVLSDDDARERQRWLAGRRPSTARECGCRCDASGRTCSQCGRIWMGRPRGGSAEVVILLDVESAGVLAHRRSLPHGGNSEFGNIF